MGLLVTLVVLLGIGQTRVSAVTMGTAFTYQGRFTSGGSPANGSFDFQFSLFDAATAGTQVGSTITKTSVSVADGYFTTALDFGSGAFTGNARWLQIAVRPAGQGSYTILTPRHELTPTPYSLYPSVLGTANYIPKFTSSGLASSVLYESGGNIGIGTTAPTRKFDISTAGQITFGDNVTYDSTAGIYWHSGAGYGMYRTAGPWTSPNYQQVLLHWDTGIILNPGTAYGKSYVDIQGNGLRVTSGNVGIGTTSPVYRLHVNSGTANNVGLFESTDPGAVILLKDNTTTGTGEAIARGGNNLDLRTNDTPRLTVLGTSGYVGIGTGAPTQMLDVSGTVRCVSLVQTSDVQLKTDIQPLGGVLDKLDQVRAVSFRWNEKAQSLGVPTDARQIGVLAQELEQVFPELVVTPEPTTVDKLLANYPEEMLTAEFRQRLQEDADKTQYKAVRYSELTAVLLEAVKELRAQNRALEQRIQALESKVK
jgi:hypothetical protein